MNILTGILIPFIGTTAGAACVFFLKDQLRPVVQKTLLGFASGVMVAASVWSLLIPAMNMSEGDGETRFRSVCSRLSVWHCIFADNGQTDSSSAPEQRETGRN